MRFCTLPDELRKARSGDSIETLKVIATLGTDSVDAILDAAGDRRSELVEYIILEARNPPGWMAILHPEIFSKRNFLNEEEQFRLLYGSFESVSQDEIAMNMIRCHTPKDGVLVNYIRNSGNEDLKLQLYYLSEIDVDGISERISKELA